MDRRNFIQTGLAVAITAATITRAAADNSIEGIDSATLDKDVVGPIFNEADVIIRGYMNDNLEWQREMQIATKLDADLETVIVLPAPATLSIEMDTEVSFNRLTAELLDIPKEIELQLPNDWPMKMYAGDILTISPSDGLLRLK